MHLCFAFVDVGATSIKKAKHCSHNRTGFRKMIAIQKFCEIRLRKITLSGLYYKRVVFMLLFMQ